MENYVNDINNIILHLEKSFNPDDDLLKYYKKELKLISEVIGNERKKATTLPNCRQKFHEERRKGKAQSFRAAR